MSRLATAVSDHCVFLSWGGDAAYCTRECAAAEDGHVPAPERVRRVLYPAGHGISGLALAQLACTACGSNLRDVIVARIAQRERGQS